METENAQVIMFSANPIGFYPKDWLEDGSYTNPPDDLTELTAGEVKTYRDNTAPEGKMLGAVKGRPAWVDLPAPTKEQLINIAEAKRNALIAEANDVTSDWKIELMLGMIGNTDKANLIEWMKYVKAVKAVDTSTAPDIVWPDKPI